LAVMSWAIPAQDGVRRQQAGDLAEDAATKWFAADSEPPPLIVGSMISSWRRVSP
jgi:hypothetical protein